MKIFTQLCSYMIEKRKIWYEIQQAKHIALSISSYNNIGIRNNKAFEILYGALSSISIIGFVIKVPAVSLATSLLILCITVIRGTIPNLFKSETEPEQLDQLAEFYILYLAKLEHLYYRLDKSLITEAEAEAEFYSLKLDETVKSVKAQRIIEKISIQSNKKIISESNMYFKSIYKDLFKIDEES